MSRKALPALAFVVCVCVALASWAAYFLTHQGKALVSGPASAHVPDPSFPARAPDPSPPAPTPAPDPAKVAAALDPYFAAPGRLSATVLDAATGDVLYQRNPQDTHAPASNVKTLTAFAALAALGADATLPTRTVLEGDSLYLVGGGDTLLGEGASRPAGLDLGGDDDPVPFAAPAGPPKSPADGHAGIATLAQLTAAQLHAAQKRSVTLSLDDTLFTGPPLRELWPDADLPGNMAPLHAVAFHGGRSVEGDDQARPQDAGMDVLGVLAAELRANGIQVSPAGRAKAPAGAVETAVVRSAPISEVVRWMYQESDNYVAEALGRLVALASGQPGSAEAATGAVLAAVREAGVDVADTVLADTCGLSIQSRLSTAVVAQVLRAALSGKDADLAQLFPAFPVAGLSGTLKTRYLEGESVAGAGLVRAKTGTLNESAALGGAVVDRGGRLLVFSFLASDITRDQQVPRKVFDPAATRLSECGCR